MMMFQVRSIPSPSGLCTSRYSFSIGPISGLQSGQLPLGNWSFLTNRRVWKKEYLYTSSDFPRASCLGIQKHVNLSRRRGPQASYSGRTPSATEDDSKQSNGLPSPVSSTDGDGGLSYLSMWKRAREREAEERTQRELEAREAEDAIRAAAEEEAQRGRREQQLQSILAVPEEEKQRVEREMVVARASAALAAAQAVLGGGMGDASQRQLERGRPMGSNAPRWAGSSRLAVRSTSQEPIRGPAVSTAQLNRGKSLSTAPAEPPPSLSDAGRGGDDVEGRTLGGSATPGPDFWTWAPSPAPSGSSDLLSQLQKRAGGQPAEPSPVLELDQQDRIADLNLPLESQVSSKSEQSFLPPSMGVPSLPPLQSLMEVVPKTAEPETGLSEVRELEWESLSVPGVPNLELQTASMLVSREESSGAEETGVHPDGTRWWRQSGVEERANGEVCRWTVVRGASADGSREWEDKWWETSDPFDYKELGAEKSGRDATGGVWRESWREAMWQDAGNGLLHIEKSADKWGRNARGGEWHEKWWEHYDAQGRAEKWADKWSKIDTATPLEAGHGHVWHERWGEEYDGRGAAMKYADKWAERCEGDGRWTKWGDKWDERFDSESRGHRGGETWWEGAHGERWNQTWGEGHNNSGWVHKYGQSSSGEHWDTSEPMDTWYERKPHFGFKECMENSGRLQQVGRAKKKRGAKRL